MGWEMRNIGISFIKFYKLLPFHFSWKRSKAVGLMNKPRDKNRVTNKMKEANAVGTSSATQLYDVDPFIVMSTYPPFQSRRKTIFY